MFDAADVIGLVGGVLIIIAFADANASETFDKLRFNAMNLMGAVLLIISLWVHFNLASMLLEVAWAVIARCDFDRETGSKNTTMLRVWTA